MADKEEQEKDKKVFDIYDQLKLEILKYDDFKPSDILRVLIMGMRLFKPLKGMRGVDKKQRLINLMKLLIREYGGDNFDGFDLHLLYYMIDDLYDNGLLKSNCVIM